MLFNHGDMYRDFTFVDDIVLGVVAVAKRPPDADRDGVRHRVYNIGNNRPVRLTDFVDTLELHLEQYGLLNGPVEREYLPMQPGEVYQTYADVAPLEKEFGVRPVTSLADGLERFVRWYKDYKYVDE